MGNIHLVTGYAGKEHVTAADQGAFNAALLGSGQFVLGKGNKLSASVITNNQIRVLDGDIYMQGRHIRLDDAYVDLTIENGAQDQMRNDLIVARYTKDGSTGVEDCNLVVIKGASVASNPADPAYTSGDILNGNATLNDMPLYRVPLDGLNVGDLVPLFDTFDISLPGMTNADNIKSGTLEAARLPNIPASKLPTIPESKLPTVPVTKGGTGATTAEAARANLGAAPAIVVSTAEVEDGSESPYPDGTLYVVIEG